MGDIIKTFPSRSSTKEKIQLLKYYFDTGSPRTFVKEFAALKMKGVLKLPQPKQFFGLGNGGFKATYMVSLEVQLLDMWVPHPCFVVPDDVLDEEYDALLGNDFMQIYDIHLKPKERDIVINKGALRMALKVRNIVK